MHWSVPVRMHIHPLRPYGGEHIDAATQLLERGKADLLDPAGNRQVEGGMPDNTEAVALQCLADGVSIYPPGGSHRRLEGQVDEPQPQGCYPLVLLENVLGRVVHRPDQHVGSAGCCAKPGTTIDEARP